MRESNTRQTLLVAAWVLCFCLSASADPGAIQIRILDPQGAPGIPQLSGTVVDTSGAVIAGANVMVRQRKRHCPKALTVRQQRLLQYLLDSRPVITGLSYLNPGVLETKEMPVTIGASGEPAPLRISPSREHREHYRRGARPGG